MDVTAYFKFKERGGLILRYSQGGSLKRGGQQNCFSSIRKESDKMGQNEYDFWNQREKLPQKHVFILRIRFDP